MESYSIYSFCLASFIQHDYFEIHPYCVIYQCINNSSLSNIWIYHDLSILPVGREFSAITNNAGMYIHVQGFVWPYAFIFLG